MTKRVRFDESDYAVSSKYRKTKMKTNHDTKDVKNHMETLTQKFKQIFQHKNKKQ